MCHVFEYSSMVFPLCFFVLSFNTLLSFFLYLLRLLNYCHFAHAFFGLRVRSFLYVCLSVRKIIRFCLIGLVFVICLLLTCLLLTSFFLTCLLLTHLLITCMLLMCMLLCFSHCLIVTCLLLNCLLHTCFLLTCL